MSTDFTSEADIQCLLATGASDESVCDAHRRLNGGRGGDGQALVGMAGAGLICACCPHLAERVLADPVQLCIENGYGSAPGNVIRYGEWVSRSEYMPQFAGSAGAL
jgi:hypothetical protein